MKLIITLSCLAVSCYVHASSITMDFSTGTFSGIRFIKSPCGAEYEAPDGDAHFKRDEALIARLGTILEEAAPSKDHSPDGRESYVLVLANKFLVGWAFGTEFLIGGAIRSGGLTMLCNTVLLGKKVNLNGSLNLNGSRQSKAEFIREVEKFSTVVDIMPGSVLSSKRK